MSYSIAACQAGWKTGSSTQFQLLILCSKPSLLLLQPQPAISLPHYHTTIGNRTSRAISPPARARQRMKCTVGAVLASLRLYPTPLSNVTATRLRRFCLLAYKHGRANVSGKSRCFVRCMTSRLSAKLSNVKLKTLSLNYDRPRTTTPFHNCMAI